MHWLIFREPVNAWTHGLWAVCALPACLLMWRMGRGDRIKQFSLLLFGVCLFLCFGGSMLYHGVRLPAAEIELCRTVDHIGIYLLIAGTVTPAAVVVLQGRWRQLTLLASWCLAALGIAVQLAWSAAPPWLYTLVYLGMGWGVCLGYFEMARALPPGAMRPIWMGGLLYTVGAVINVADWPQLAPGVFGAHELWHLFGVAGSFCHFWFMVRWVAPFPRRRAGSLATPIAGTPRVAVALSLSAPMP